MGKIIVHNIYGEQDEEKRNEKMLEIVIKMIERNMAAEKENQSENK